MLSDSTKKKTKKRYGVSEDAGPMKEMITVSSSGERKAESNSSSDMFC